MSNATAAAAGGYAFANVFGIFLVRVLPVERGDAVLAMTLASFALYAAAIGINLWRGRADIDCGCAGPDQAQPLRPVLLARNSALVLLALVASIAPVARDLNLFDGFVTLAAAAVALLIYAAADGLLANSPLLLKLIGR